MLKQFKFITYLIRSFSINSTCLARAMTDKIFACSSSLMHDVIGLLVVDVAVVLPPDDP